LSRVDTRERAATLTRDLVRVAVAAASDEERVRRPAGRSLFDYLACLEAGRLLAERERLAIEETTFRIYAASGFAHAAIEAARDRAPVESAERVEVQVPPATAALAALVDPQTEEEAWWSTQYAVAVTLLGLDIEDRSLLHDPRVRELLGRVEMRAGETSTVTVDGRSASCAEAHVPTNEELGAKWRMLNPGLQPPLELLA
jgi:2-methylcitrate dehydratase PrpD